ncbi:sensor domain-containing diguanylate cyclase [Peribacillus sp. NPDC097675]|uniref:sensor domain-containing diguanylate cyclase n=1 Tax=Peribacillus sp. NPDC097675 TaxID=3390618 RepID=UPI003D029E9F
MNISRKKRMAIYVIWFLVMPASLVGTFHVFPPIQSGHTGDIAAFLVLISVLAFMPIMTNNIPITVVQGVSLAVFLVFGLATEIVVTQVAFISIIVRLRLAKEDWYRFPLNSIASFIFCLMSGLVYYGLGGDHDFSSGIDAIDILLILVYQCSYFLFNQVVFMVAHWVIYRKKLEMKTKDAIWDGFTSLMIMPIGIILFVLYIEMGSLAILLVGAALVSLAFIMKQFYFTKEINRHLKKVSEFGHQLTRRLQANEVLDLFIDGSSAIIPSKYTLVFEIFDEKENAQILRYAENGVQIEKRIKPVSIKEGIYATLFQLKKTKVFHSKKEWKHLANYGNFPEDVESIMAIPIFRNSVLVGEIIVTSSKKRAYGSHQTKIMDILSSYLWVALENARHYQETKYSSERCALTHLYNFRYFECVLHKEFERLQNQSLNQLSLLLLDIDHFKSVNDTYGHQSGNEILCELAERLDGIVGDSGTTARYGGEEFVILLPNVGKEEIYQFAEFIRLSIANKPFTVHSDLNESRRKESISITASIGVATAPIDAEDAQSIIRHADRAMYTGAKQAGRNKVAVYEG